jgi:hypothetical protein
MPGESTPGRAVRDVDISEMEQRLARHMQQLAAQRAEEEDGDDAEWRNLTAKLCWT